MHEWRITRLVVKSGHQIDMCYDNIELCAQNIKNDLGSTVNTIGRLYVIA